MTKQLVFLDEYIKAEPYTTSEIIAEFADISHHGVQALISKRKADLEKFGKVAFEMRPLTDSQTVQKEKIFLLNDPQATLLITYLKNTDAENRKSFVFYFDWLESISILSDKEIVKLLKALV